MLPLVTTSEGPGGATPPEDLPPKGAVPAGPAPERVPAKPPVPESAPDRTAPRLKPWTRLEFLALIGITLVAALLRFVSLADPPDLVFDETYYAKDACWYVETDAELCEVESEQTQVHPPLGKWLISAGVEAFGYDSFGWRFVPAVFGVASVPLLFVLARRLFRMFLPALVAATLLTFDFLHFVQSRTSMLDIFVMFFGMAALLFMLLDRDRMLERVDAGQSPWVARLMGRPWRIAAGVAAGAATASKWSGAFVVLAVIVLATVWDLSARRESEVDTDPKELKGEILSIALWLALLPLVVYMFTYIARLDGTLFALPWSDDSWLREWVARQRYMMDYHHDLEAHHSYESPPWSWLLLKRPVAYFFCSGAKCNPAIAEGDYREIIATGSPFVWWSSIVAMLFLGVAWVRARLRRAGLGRPEGLIVAGIAFTYGPWLLPIFDRDAVFIFYLLPTVPFMCLALAYAFMRLGESWEARAAVSLFVAGSMGLFAYYYPLLVKKTIPQPEWQKRIWIFDGSEACSKPPGEIVTTTATLTDGGETSISVGETEEPFEGPPKGWCWI